MPRKLKRSTGNPKLFRTFIVWKTTLLCMVPPYRGCGWHTRAACAGCSLPVFRRASRRPAGPSMKRERIVEETTDSSYPHQCSGIKLHRFLEFGETGEIIGAVQEWRHET